MSRLIPIVLVVIFTAWIIPLGAFIDAAQEKKICNGRRAVCLCTNYAKKQQSKNVVQKIQRQRRSAEASLSFPSFGTNFVLVQDYSITHVFPSESIRVLNSMIVVRLVDPPTEPVPKQYTS